MSIAFTPVAEHVVAATLDRPPHNYFAVDTLAVLVDGIAAAAADGARAVVLRAEGRSFCAGADFREGGLGGGDAEARRAFYESALQLQGSPIPVVAAVHGAAVGGGAGLALACDLRVVCPEAWFATTFTRLGTAPGFAITENLPRTVGAELATEMLLTGRRVHGAEAAATGLARRCVPRDRLVGEAVALAEEVAASAPLAVAEVRRMLFARRLPALRRAVDEELAAQARLRATADFAEGVEALVQARPPVFTGR